MPVNSVSVNIWNSDIAGIHKNVVAQVLTHSISSLVLSGACKTTGYENLRHGASFDSYKSIIKWGANPKYGGRTTKNYYESNTFVQAIEYADGRREEKIIVVQEMPANSLSAKAANKFYVFRDTEFGKDEANKRVMNCFKASMNKRIGPIIHSTWAYLAQYSIEGKKESKWNIIKALGKAFFTPKLKFIFSLEEIKGNANKKALFIPDPDYKQEEAYYTEVIIPSDRIGLLGFISHFDKKHAWNHIKSNPGRVIQGVAQLGLGIIFTGVGLGFIT